MLSAGVSEYLRKGKMILAGVLLGICMMIPGAHVSAVSNEHEPVETVEKADTVGTETGEPLDEVQIIKSEWGDPLFYMAFGDSIPNGYAGAGEQEVTSYPVFLAGDLHKVSGRQILMSRFTKNGLTTKKLNQTILQESEVQELLGRADVITLTIGSNDLMNEFKKVSREILNNETRFFTADEALVALQEGIAENPLLLMNVVSAIGGWDYGSFEEQWVLALETIRSYCKEDAQIAVTTIYNPMKGRELPGTLNAVVESVISGMNEIIWKHAEEYGYKVVDLFDSGIEELTQSDGLHPNQDGQDMIRMLMENELDLGMFQKEESNEEVLKMQQELEEAAKKAAREAEQKRQQERRRRILFGAGTAAAAVVIIAVIFVVIRRRKRKKAEAER